MNHNGIVLLFSGAFFLVGIITLIRATCVPAAPQGTMYLDDSNWYNAFFYNNPDDPALFVPRRSGWGWTLNFGHPNSRPFLIGIVFIVLGALSLSALYLGAPSGCHPTTGCHF
jgi:uncharacterized membrane protein